MKKDDRIPPPSLARMQERFGKAIRTPFSFSTGRFRCRQDEYSGWAEESIAPRGHGTGSDRIAIYNEQYWYRLLTVLQRDFPLLAATMGMWEFNRLATAFLERHPSRSPYLQNLADGLTEFLRSNPVSDNPRLAQIAALETALLNAFHAPSIPPLDPGVLASREAAMLPAASLVFQPWLSLVEEDWNLMECRIGLVEKGIEKPRYMDRKGYWAVFRNGTEVEWMELDAIRFNLLEKLRSGRPLESACESLLDDLDPAEAESLAARLPSWFETWTRLQWFGRPSFEGLSFEGMIEGSAEVV